MTIYKIKDKYTGLFSTGGAYPEWGKNGKIWVGTKYLKAHLNLVKKSGFVDRYKDAEILVFDVHESNTIAVNRYMGL